VEQPVGVHDPIAECLPDGPAGRLPDRSTARRLRVGVAGAALLAVLGGPWSVAGPEASAAPRLPVRTIGADLPAPSNALVTVAGAGFGHGVGMSQYGAYGMARAGAGVAAILTHYFTGTSVVSYPDAGDLRVNVVDRGARVTLRSVALAAGGGAFELVSADGATTDLTASDVATVTPSDGALQIAVTHGDGTVVRLTTATLGVRWSGGRGLAGPATVLQVGSRTPEGAGKTRRYRWGSLALVSVRRLDPDGVTRPRVEANALVDLHAEYLRGVAEMPYGWADAALQAQAVAARTYALTHRTRTLSGCGGCTLWDDTRSQVYQGWDAESGPSGGRWVQAVAATQTSRTASLAVLYRGTPIEASYSSSTGGRTRDAASVWGSDVPYLRSVDDPWSVDRTINPRYSAWTRTVAVSRLCTVFGLADLASIAVTARDAAGAATEVEATSSDGEISTRSGATLRSALGLPSQWVTSFAVPR